MTLKVKTQVHHGKRSNVAFAYSTKDRVEFTKQTIAPILNEDGEFDLFWMDGSDGAGLALATMPEWAANGKLTETHCGVTGGAATAIQYSLMTLYNKNYDYIGLIENDVLLFDGWFQRIMDLFKTCPLPIGAVSARTFTGRILKRYGDYVEMANVGAGMILFKRDMVPYILMNWRMPMLWEVEAFCAHFRGEKYPIPPQVLQQDPERKQDFQMTHDWFFEPVLWNKGRSVYAPVPSMAVNLDDLYGTRDPVEGIDLPLKKQP